MTKVTEGIFMKSAVSKAWVDQRVSKGVAGRIKGVMPIGMGGPGTPTIGDVWSGTGGMSGNI